ncbi:unnamed protein product [Phytophthora fragariaefolia]|uniref:Unnamed protein product n=1 Tax=Phytophthora fragariaefolia TaxID=1490495 RepID=A0A9W6TRF7_9STRA|nr:unnamed protein product [Phytophthora fragariaefolia]
MSPSTAKVEASTIKEWHFHTCYLANNQRSKEEAQALRDALVERVKADPKNFIAVCNGVTGKELQGLEGTPPPFNLGPVGPHLSGSFETWVPAESFAQVLSWFTLHRESLSILVHPLTRYEREDHSTHALWLGQAFPIDLEKLQDDLLTPPLQYPELGLGYSATADGQ